MKPDALELLGRALNPYPPTAAEGPRARNLVARGLLRPCPGAKVVATDEGRAELGLPPIPSLPDRGRLCPVRLALVQGGKRSKRPEPKQLRQLPLFSKR
jgi:hypothetical protein